jgi:mRNA interferase RelE/StbE
MPGNKKYRIEYLASVVEKDIPTLPTVWKKNIRQAIEGKLQDNPEVFGKPLRKSLRGFRSLRVGDYRVIYMIETCIILIVVIQHRSVVYQKLEGRM